MMNTELFRLESFVDDMRVIITHFSAFGRELKKMRDYFIFVNLYCFKKKFQLSDLNKFGITEDQLLTMLIQLFVRLIKETEDDHRLLQSYTFLMTFFSHVNASLDKKLIGYLSGLPKNEVAKFNHQHLRIIGTILLSHNMPRSSSYFFYRPKKEARRIKFYTYFDCCKKLAFLKVNRRGSDIHRELQRLVIVFASLKEFKFAEDYLLIISEILKELYDLIDRFMENINAPVVEGAPVKSFDASGYLLNIQRQIQRLAQCTECHLSADRLSKNACNTYQKFMCIIYKYLECYQSLDQYSIRKIRQSLAEFLYPKIIIFSSELYYIFRAKKLLTLIDSVIERNMKIPEAKVKILSFIQEIDYLMLPKRLFLSVKTPRLRIPQEFLWQIEDKDMVSSLKEHIIDIEVEVENFNEKILNEWSIEISLVAITDSDIKKIQKRVIKKALPLINFQFLVEFTTICKYCLSTEIMLLDSTGYAVDKLSFQDYISVV